MNNDCVAISSFTAQQARVLTVPVLAQSDRSVSRENRRRDAEGLAAGVAG